MMITFEEALKKANEIKSGIDCGTILENGYIFDRRKDAEAKRIGGMNMPVYIFKDSGEIVPSVVFMLGNRGEPLKDFDIKSDGTIVYSVPEGWD